MFTCSPNRLSFRLPLHQRFSSLKPRNPTLSTYIPPSCHPSHHLQHKSKQTRAYLQDKMAADTNCRAQALFNFGCFGCPHGKFGSSSREYQVLVGESTINTSTETHQDYNCALTLKKLPDGTTYQEVFDALAAHWPLDKITEIDIFRPDPTQNRLRTEALVQFATPEGALRLRRIFRDHGFLVRGVRVKVRPAASAGRAARTLIDPGFPDQCRVILLRGPADFVNRQDLENCSRSYMGNYIYDRLIEGQIQPDGTRMVEWRFTTVSDASINRTFLPLCKRDTKIEIQWGIDPCA